MVVALSRESEVKNKDAVIRMAAGIKPDSMKVAKIPKKDEGSPLLVGGLVIGGIAAAWGAWKYWPQKQ